MVSHYPNQTALVAAMVDLAVEELNHYKEVMRLLMAKGLTPAADRKDPYVTRLNKLVRKDSAFFLLDRLLMGAIVERRGAERFGLVAKHIEDLELKVLSRPLQKRGPSLAFVRSARSRPLRTPPCRYTIL